MGGLLKSAPRRRRPVAPSASKKRRGRGMTTRLDQHPDNVGHRGPQTVHFSNICCKIDAAPYRCVGCAIYVVQHGVRHLRCAL
eukprot:6123466-Pyramimonas_sp.AAC.1